MSLEVTGYGFVEDGKLTVDDRSALRAGLVVFNGEEVEYIIRKRRYGRSNQSLRYYWGPVLGTIVARLKERHMDIDAEELHEMMKMRFLPKAIALTDDNGVVVDSWVIGGSIRKLSQADFSDFIDRVKAYAWHELQVVIPDANNTEAA